GVRGCSAGLKLRDLDLPVRADHKTALARAWRRWRGASALLKVTFKDLHRVSLDPGSITRIARAALALVQREHGRTT
ncbi:hypothetical protein PV723_34430, partial [Streptomyces sp. AK04-3B]|nr:hypothetical protein [Streptomyces sp. AK04-3B]